MINADGSGQENLTQHPARDSHPSWSRDGRKLAFVSRRDGNSEIYVMNADGSGLRNVTRAPSNDLGPAWSPDGRAIAFVRDPGEVCGERTRHSVQQQLRDVPLCRERRRERAAATDNTAGVSVQTQLVGGREDDPVRALSRAGRRQRADRGCLGTSRPNGAWSPDGKRIAFALIDTSPGNRTDEDHGLWVVNADGSNRRQLTRYHVGSNPVWSPDGRRIAFRRLNWPPLPSAGNSDLYVADLYVVNADGSGLRRLTRHAENVPRSFAWSPDGRTIAFLHNREVYIVKADGSDERRLTQLNK